MPASSFQDWCHQPLGHSDLCRWFWFHIRGRTTKLPGEAGFNRGSGLLPKLLCPGSGIYLAHLRCGLHLSFWSRRRQLRRQAAKHVVYISIIFFYFWDSGWSRALCKTFPPNIASWHRSSGTRRERSRRVKYPVRLRCIPPGLPRKIYSHLPYASSGSGNNSVTQKSERRWNCEPGRSCHRP